MSYSKLEKWEEEGNLERIIGWFRDGLTDELVATKKMGIGVSTFYKWKSQSKKLKEAVKKGKEPADVMVVSALFKRCIGYDVEEYRITPDGSKTTTTRHIPPDVGAIALWLKNRCRDKWRDRWDVEVANNVPVVINDNVKK